MKRAKTEAKRVQPTRSTPNLSFKPKVRTGGVPPNRKMFTPKGQIICHNCGLPGHFKSECMKLRIIANQPEVGQLTAEARLAEVDDLHLEVAAAARIAMAKEAGLLGN
jgi:hypothetical protein